MAQRCLFLDLCQELRDLIYEYALIEDYEPVVSETPSRDDVERTRTLATLSSDHTKDPGGWHYRLPTTLETPTWLALMQGNRQLHAEVTDYLARRSSHKADTQPAAKMTLHLNHPTAIPELTCLPIQPQHLRTLDITLHLSNLYHPRIKPPSYAVATAVWMLIQRYCTHSPRLARSQPLLRPLQLDKVRITLAEPDQREMGFEYGNPWMQMQSHYSSLKWGLGVVVREAEAEVGMVGVGVVETTFRGKGWESVFVAERVRKKVEDEKVAAP